MLPRNRLRINNALQLSRLIGIRDQVCKEMQQREWLEGSTASLSFVGSEEKSTRLTPKQSTKGGQLHASPVARDRLLHFFCPLYPFVAILSVSEKVSQKKELRPGSMILQYMA